MQTTNGDSSLRLGTRLTIYLSLIIIIALSGYGYYHIMSRRDILIRKMKTEVRSIGRTLKVSLEKVSLTREMEYVQDLIDAVEEDEKTLGVIVYHQGKGIVFRSRSLEEGLDPYLEVIKNSIQEDYPQEEFGVYKKSPIFAYAFPLKDRKGKSIGGVSILQHTSFMEEDIRKAKRDIFIAALNLIQLFGALNYVEFRAAIHPTWCMARPVRLERTACGFEVRRSIQLSYGRFGVSEGTRTLAHWGHNPVLYPTELHSPSNYGDQ